MGSTHPTPSTPPSSPIIASDGSSTHHTLLQDSSSIVRLCSCGQRSPSLLLLVPSPPFSEWLRDHHRCRRCRYRCCRRPSSLHSSLVYPLFNDLQFRRPIALRYVFASIESRSYLSYPTYCFSYMIPHANRSSTSPLLPPLSQLTPSSRLPSPPSDTVATSPPQRTSPPI